MFFVGQQFPFWQGSFCIALGIFGVFLVAPGQKSSKAPPMSNFSKSFFHHFHLLLYFWGINFGIFFNVFLVALGKKSLKNISNVQF